MNEEKRFEPDDPEQSAKFIEFAKQVETEETRERFEDAMKRIAAARKRKAGKDDDG